MSVILETKQLCKFYGAGENQDVYKRQMRGSISDVKAAMEVAIRTAEPIAKVVSHTVIASPSEETETAIAMTITK